MFSKIMKYKDEITLTGAIVCIVALGGAALATVTAYIGKIRG